MGAVQQRTGGENRPTAAVSRGSVERPPDPARTRHQLRAADADALALATKVGDGCGLGLYVHFPWCVKKCPYCDFNSHPLGGELQEDAYVRALQAEFLHRIGAGSAVENRPFDSVFFGGGTPSLFSAKAMEMLIATLRPYLRDGAEITMEANPGAAERGELTGYRDAGITRLSIGAQSFSSVSLQRLGRIHGPDDTRACIEAARRGGFDNINLDIMYGLPGQSIDEALTDLQAALALSPEHLSWYQLTIEPRTEFARRTPAGIPGEDAIADMEDAGRTLLRQAGFARYEISAYARPGAACLHNLVYWTFGDYIGLGAGAHGKLGATTARPRGAGYEDREAPTEATFGTPHQAKHARAPRHQTLRTRNPRQPRLYLENPCHTDTFRVSPEDVPGEFMMNVLRLVEGAEQSLFESRTGLSWERVEAVWQKTTALGLTESDRIAATPHGLQHLDALVQFFLR